MTRFKHLILFPLLMLLSYLSYSQSSYIRVFGPVSQEFYPSKDGAKWSNSTELNRILEKYKAIKYYQSFPGAKYLENQKYYTIQFNSEKVDSLILELKKIKAFEDVKKVRYSKPTSCTNPVTFNDPFFHHPDWLVNPYHLKKIQAECAWTITQGDTNVVVAVVDTEFDTNHEDLKGKFVHLNTESGWSHYKYHGTAVSSLVAATTNNGTGVASIGNKVKLAGYLVALGTTGMRADERAWVAYQEGFRIINISFDYITYVSTLFQEMVDNGVTIVVAGGNLPTDNYHSIIGAINGVIVVGSTDSMDKIGPPGFSVQSHIEVCAPGLSIPFAHGNSSLKYHVDKGTSLSAPIVAGTVALMRSVNKCLTPAQIETILKETCDPIVDAHLFPTLTNAVGRINAYRAVQAASTFNTTTEINNHTLWSIDRVQSGNVIVKSGWTLTITGTVTMLCEGSKILVEKGAKLVIDGGRITTPHLRTQWKGIELRGDRNLPPEPANQGALEMKNNAKVENARVGVANFIWNGSEAPGGGLISATNSKFINCRKAVELNDYSNYSYKTSSFSPSRCYFNNVEFVINNEQVFQNTAQYPHLFTSWAVLSGIEIINCKFNLAISRPWGASRGYAIEMATSGALIRNCTFNNFDYGVHTSTHTGSPTRNVTIQDNTFQTSYQSIVLAGSTYATVKGNSISSMQLPPGTVGTAAGIYVDQGRGAFIGCENTINGSTIFMGYRHNGIITNNTQLLSIQIGDNTLTNCNAAYQNQGNGRNIKVYCNTFINNNIAMNINPATTSIFNGHHFTHQGTGCLITQELMKNNFANNGSSNMDIVSSPNLASTWEYICSSMPEFPTNISGSTVNVMGCISFDGGPRFICQKGTSACGIIIVIGREELNKTIDEYNSLVSRGEKNSVEGEMLLGSIIRGFNSLDDKKGLQAFLEKEEDNEANKMLIPLYIETEQYDLATRAIANLKVSEKERTAYQDYYNIIANLQKENRRIDKLHETELATVSRIAKDSFEVTPFAKSLLSMGYDQKWIHPVDENREEDMMIYSSQTQLGLSEIEKAPNWIKAIPNPANQMVTIQTQIESLQNTAQVVLRNIAGRTIVTESLREGYNEVTIDLKNIESGMYIYSLISNGRVVESKLLSVIK